MTFRIAYLDYDQIAPKRYDNGAYWNLRGDVGDTTDLQQSIAEGGLRDPIEVTEPDSNGIHYIENGHRRWTALGVLLREWTHQLNAFKKQDADGNANDIRSLQERIQSLRVVPVLITGHDADDSDAIFEQMLTSFMARPLDPVSMGQAIRRLRDVHGWSIARVATRIGMSVDKAELYLSTLLASDHMQQMVKSGQVSLTTYSRFLAKKSARAQDAILEVLEEKGQEATGTNVRSVLREQVESHRATILPMFADLDVLPALNAALVKLQFAHSKLNDWTPSTRIAAGEVMREIVECVDALKPWVDPQVMEIEAQAVLGVV